MYVSRLPSALLSCTVDSEHDGFWDVSVIQVLIPRLFNNYLISLGNKWVKRLSVSNGLARVNNGSR